MFYKLKILFFPCQENEYLPNFLDPRRMLFYALSAFLIKAVVVIFMVIFPIEAWLTPDVKILEAEKIIKLTNKARQEAGVHFLKENFLLNSSALAKAEDILINDYFAHISPQGKKASDWFSDFKYDYLFAGENLAMGFPSGEAVVNAWLRSPTHYTNIIDSDYKEVGVGIAEGYYKGKPTVVFVQHFGQKKENDKSFEPNSSDSQTFIIDLSRTKIVISHIFNGSNFIIKAETYLSPKVRQAEVDFGNHRLILYPSNEDKNFWIGSAIISKQEKKEILSNIVMASLKVVDSSGNKFIKDVEWEDIIPEEPNLINRYFFMRFHPSVYIESFLNLSLWYISILIILLSITLFLSIFINIKKQYPLIILTTMILILFLGILIIF